MYVCGVVIDMSIHKVWMHRCRVYMGTLAIHTKYACVHIHGYLFTQAGLCSHNCINETVQ